MLRYAKLIMNAYIESGVASIDAKMRETYLKWVVHVA